MTRITVQYRVNGQYGEMTAKSEELSAQEMVDKIYESAKRGLEFRFLADAGIMVPTGYQGDSRLYIPSKAEGEK